MITAVDRARKERCVSVSFTVGEILDLLKQAYNLPATAEVIAIPYQDGTLFIVRWTE